MARLVAATCPTCGALLEVDPHKSEVECASCGTTSLVQRRSLFGRPALPARANERPVVHVLGRPAVVFLVVAVCLGVPMVCVSPVAAALILTARKRGGTVRKPTPADTMEVACGGGSGRQCFQAGYAYEHGQGRPKDMARAVTFYEKACKQKYAEGCANLGWAYEEGNGVERDYVRAAELHDKACRLRNATGCNNLGYAHQRGVGVEQDMAKAVSLYEQACAMGSALGCNNAGVTASDNPAIRDDPEKIDNYFEIACNRGHGGGCRNLAERVEKHDPARGAELYQKACTLGATVACKR
jgi:hypothetical protein